MNAETCEIAFGPASGITAAVTAAGEGTPKLLVPKPLAVLPKPFTPKAVEVVATLVPNP